MFTFLVDGVSLFFLNLVGSSIELTKATDLILNQINPSVRRDELAGMLSYAEQHALEIGITVAGRADVIILDEPTTSRRHSETDYIVELIRKVAEKKTLIMVEHDMGVVFRLAGRISVLFYVEIIATGRPEDVRANSKV